MTLHIPDVDDDQDTLSAALAYARAGWYVLPVDQATKHAGSVLGKGWPAKSSRDAETLISWFAGQDYALALHIGRSGAVCLDVDRPEELPPLLVAALGVIVGPFQSTRTSDDRRGHYLYGAPPGRILGNSNGGLGKTWGEVRGKNGVIVVAPSTHEKAEAGGRYHWARTGTLPTLPAPVAAQLPDAGDSSDAATDGEVRAFLDKHVGKARPELLTGVLTQFSAALATGESRHGIALRATAGAMREAAAGLYPALAAAMALLEAFTSAMSSSRDGTERRLTRAQARSEFMGVLAWAVAQSAAADLAALRADVDDRLGRDDLSDLIAPVDRTAEPPPFAGADQALSQIREDGQIGHDDEGEVDLEALAFEREVATEVRKLKIREEAARRARKARAGTAARPPIVGLGEFLAVPDEPARYRIEGLLPVGARAVLAAQFKAGKTTLMGNLVRSLVDSTPFLGKFDVQPFAGKVAVLDDELDERMVRRWLRDQGIVNVGSAAVVSLRGRLSSFDLLDPQTRSEWAAELRAAGVTIVILDCLAPILDALGLSEDKEAGRFLVAYDEMLKEANASESILVHHMGHSGERSRGASRLRDWPDVEWRLVREKNDDGETEPSGKRFFSAYGRDVDVPESLLSYEPSTRRLEVSGGSRRDAKHAGTSEAITEFLTLSPGSSGRQVEDALPSEEHPQKAVREALKALISAGRVRRSPGARGAHLHWLAGGSSALQDHSKSRVNNVSAGQPSALSALILNASISEDDHTSKTSALQDQRTQTPGHSASALSASGVRHALGGECVSASPYGGGRTDALIATHDPRDPSDLIAPAGRWFQIDGQWINADTGEVSTEAAS